MPPDAQGAGCSAFQQSRSEISGRAHANGRRPSNVARRAAGMGYCIAGPARQASLVGAWRDRPDRDAQTAKNSGRRSDQRVLRSGEAKYAVIAGGMAGRVRWRARSTRIVVVANRKAGRCLTGRCDQTKAAEHDEKALRGDRIGDAAADHCAPEPPTFSAGMGHSLCPVSARYGAKPRRQCQCTPGRANSRQAGRFDGRQVRSPARCRKADTTSAACA
jgi:hypothetical protein